MSPCLERGCPSHDPLAPTLMYRELVSLDMEDDTMKFGAPFAGLVLGLIVLIVGIFMGGLTYVAIAGGAIALLAILGLTYSAFEVAGAH